MIWIKNYANPSRYRPTARGPQSGIWLCYCFLVFRAIIPTFLGIFIFGSMKVGLVGDFQDCESSLTCRNLPSYFLALAKAYKCCADGG